MTPAEQKSRDQLLLELEELTLRLQEAEQTLDAIRSGGVDALVVSAGSGQEQLYTLDGADRVYRVFLESISQGALTLSADGLVLFANEAAGRLLSAKMEVVVGAQLQSFVHAADRERMDALFERGLGQPVNAEIRVRGGGGRPLYLSLHPLKDRDDKMVVAVLSDLTEQRRTEAALEAEGLARAIFEQAGEAIVVCDNSGAVIRASRAAVELAGRQLLFQALDDVLPLTEADGTPVQALQGGAEPEFPRGREVRLVRDDGRSFDLILTANPLTTQEHGHVGQVVTLADVTRLKRAEGVREKLLRDLEKANRELATIESLSRAGLQPSSTEELVQSIVSHATEAMGADAGAILLASDGILGVVALAPFADGGHEPFGSEGGFVQTIARMRRTLFVEDVESSRLLTEAERQRGVRSLLGVPLVQENELLGVLCVGWSDQHDADEGQQRFLEIIAARAAQGISARMIADQRDEQRIMAETLALELAEANVVLRGKQGSLELLHDLANLVNSSLSLTEISRSVLLVTEQPLGLRAGVICQMDPAGALVVLAQTGFDESSLAPLQVPQIDARSLELLMRRDVSIITHESVPAPDIGPIRLTSGSVVDDARWVALPLRKEELMLGVVALIFLGRRPFTEDEISLYRSIAGLLGAVFENARVHAEETVAQVRKAAEEERIRLARDLHDSITQALFAAALKAEALTGDDAVPPEALQTAREVRRLTRGALAQMRSMLLELRSDPPEDVPIDQLLRNVAEATEGRSSVAVTLSVSGADDLPRHLHPVIYRIAQEALNNVVRHARATHASIELSVEPDRARLLVRDDGCGFDPGRSLSPTHVGLRSMQERAAETGAELRVVSAPGEGTLVTFDWRAH
jgi:PAS domain S-box-containing protein